MFMRVFAGVLLSFCFAFSSWAAEAGKGISIFIAYTGIKPILEAVPVLVPFLSYRHLSYRL